MTAPIPPAPLAVEAYDVVVATLAGLLGLAVVAWFVVFYLVGAVWIRARLAGTPVGLFRLARLRFRGAPVDAAVDARAHLVRSGVEVPSLDEILAQGLAGGDPRHVATAVIAARRGGVALTWGHACAIERAGRDPEQLVREALGSRNEDCPAEGGVVRATTSDGHAVGVRARLSLRASLDDAATGIGVDELVRRIAVELADAVGKLDAARVRGEPAAIGARVRAAGVDAGAAYRIVDLRIVGVQNA